MGDGSGSRKRKDEARPVAQRGGAAEGQSRDGVARLLDSGWWAAFEWLVSGF